jgi:hypothetical protein
MNAKTLILLDNEHNRDKYCHRKGMFNRCIYLYPKESSMNNMRHLKYFLIVGLLAIASSTASATDVGVSISIGQPGFYGRIDIGDYPYPQPRFIYNRPIIVHHHIDVYEEPLYLRVPLGHAKNWSRYCSRYNACGHPVYFVQDSWYHNEYAPIYRERHDNTYHNRNDYNYSDSYNHNQRHNNKNGRGKSNHKSNDRR